jgi:hypothetical protein
MNKTDKMYGVVDGLYYCNLDRTYELDRRISARNLPSGPLQAVVDTRPVPTKYSLMDIVDRRVIPTVPLINQPDFNISNTFTPGNTKSPWSGYARKVNDESSLRNQFFGIQNNAQSAYIPGSKSDMYMPMVDPGPPIRQDYPLLFKKEEYAPFNPNICGMGGNIFNNYTRQQLKDL